MANLANASISELQGNSQFLVLGGVLYITGNTSSAGTFVIYASTDYGITATQVATYTFPSPPTPVAFDPALCTDGTNIYLIGSRQNAGAPGGPPPTSDIVWFKFAPNISPLLPGTLTGPVAAVSGLLLGSDYDVISLSSGETYAVICQFFDDVAHGTLLEQVNGYLIAANGVAGSPTLITSSAARSGLTYDSVSLLTPDGSHFELYTTSHAKALAPQLGDYTMTVGLFASPDQGGTWGAITSLLTQAVRHVSSDLTVVPGLSTNTPSSVNSRWLSTTYYTQNRAGLAGNILLGYIPDVTNISSVPWNFKQFVGTPQASLIEASLNVFTDNSVVFGFITRDLTKNPAVDGLVSVNQLSVATWQYVPRLDFRNPNPLASWLRGTKAMMPLVANWGFIGQARSSGDTTFYSGYLVPPVAAIVPVAVDPALRGLQYVFDASTSFDLNFNTLQYRWGQPPYEVDGTLSSGTFVVGEVATQAHTLATGVVNAYSSYSSSLFFGSITGSPDNSHNWVGGVSGAVFAPSTVPTLYGGLVYPAWQSGHGYSLNDEVVDPFGNVQVITTAGTSGGSTPFVSNTTVGTPTPDNGMVWTNTGTVNDVTLAVSPSGFQATLNIPYDIGPSAQTFQVQVAVVDIDSGGNPIHTPPTGTQIASALVTLLFVTPPVIAWPGTGDYSPNPINDVPRNSTLLIVPEITLGQPGLPVTYAWAQVSGTPVTIISTTTGPTLGILTNGVSVNGEALVFQLTVDDDVNIPVISTVTVNVVAYAFNGQDSLVLAASNWVHSASYGVEALTSVAVADDVLTVVVPNNFKIGETVSFASVSRATFLNGQTVTIATASAAQFTAAFTNPDYAPLADAGEVFEAYTIPASPMYVVTVQNPPAAGQTFVDGGVTYLDGTPLVYVLTAPVMGEYNLDFATGQYFFAAADASTAVIASYSLTSPATIAQRNTPLTWASLSKSAIYTNANRYRRGMVLSGDSRIAIISPYSVLIYGDMIPDDSAVLLRELLIPTYDNGGHPGLVVDAIQTELDYAIVLTTTGNLYRYSSAPLLSTDNPDTELVLSNYITLTAPTPPSWAMATFYALGTEILDANGNIQLVAIPGTSGSSAPPWNATLGGVTDDTALVWKNIGPPVVFNSLFSTPTFDNVRVLALSGPDGCFLMQMDSQLFRVEGFFEISKESGLVYGSDNVQWVREASVESLRSGKVLLGTLDGEGHTYETLIDLTHRLVIGTWDASKLKNQYVTTGEILFEQESSYVGLPVPPVMQTPVVNPDNSVTLAWAAERPDLVGSYQLQYAGANGVFTPLTFIGSGIVESYTTLPLSAGETYGFRVRSGSADGQSVFSNTVYAYIGTPLPPAAQQIIHVSGPSGGPFVVTVTWNQNLPTPQVAVSYTVQMSTGTLYAAEAHTVPAHSPYNVVVTHPPAGNLVFADGGVAYAATGIPFTLVAANPALGEYTVTPVGAYGFSSSDASASVAITYTNSAPFLTVATVQGGTNESYTAGPLAAGLVYSFQVAANFNNLSTGYSGISSITFPSGAEVAVPAQFLPNGTHGVPYSAQVVAGIFTTSPQGTELQYYGVPPYAWTVASGSLPTGLSLNAHNGIISGTPTVPGPYTFTLQAVDSAEPATYTAVSPALTITIS